MDDAPNPVRKLRTDRRLTLDEMAEQIGIARSYLSAIERGGPCSPKVALSIEALSPDAIDAALLNDDVAAARRPVQAQAVAS